MHLYDNNIAIHISGGRIHDFFTCIILPPLSLSSLSAGSATIKYYRHLMQAVAIVQIPNQNQLTVCCLRRASLLFAQPNVLCMHGTLSIFKCTTYTPQSTRYHRNPSPCKQQPQVQVLNYHS